MRGVTRADSREDAVDRGADDGHALGAHGAAHLREDGVDREDAHGGGLARRVRPRQDEQARDRVVVGRLVVAAEGDVVGDALAAE